MRDARSYAAINQIISLAKDITVEKGYPISFANVTYGLRHPDLVTQYPELGVDIGDSLLEPKDDKRDIYDELVDVSLTAICGVPTEGSADPEKLSELFRQGELVIHSLKMFLHDIHRAYIQALDNPWNIEQENNEIRFERLYALGEQRNKGLVSTLFTMRLRNAGDTFEIDLVGD